MAAGWAVDGTAEGAGAAEQAAAAAAEGRAPAGQQWVGITHGHTPSWQTRVYHHEASSCHEEAEADGKPSRRLPG